MLGPQPRVDLLTRFTPPATVGSLDEWLAQREARIPAIRPGLEKQILWHDPVHPERTAVSVVYIHGFSASKGETRPLADRIARALGANLFYTRLAGHGADGASLGEATATQWLDDTAEALWIGSRIGERTVVIGTSTGATLLTPLLADEQLSAHVAAAIFISPNFGLRARGSSLLTLPFGGLLTRMVVGAERSIAAINAGHEKYWTLRYPSRALLPMAGLVKAVETVDYGRIRTPAFFYYSRQDQVVDPDATDRVFAAWGGPAAKAQPGPVEDPSVHVLAGDALSPSGTGPAVSLLTDWLRAQLRL